MMNILLRHRLSSACYAFSCGSGRAVNLFQRLLREKSVKISVLKHCETRSFCIVFCFFQYCSVHSAACRSPPTSLRGCESREGIGRGRGALISNAFTGESFIKIPPKFCVVEITAEISHVVTHRGQEHSSQKSPFCYFKKKIY